jgi:DNA-binding GntR family transcriptional regulator
MKDRADRTDLAASDATPITKPDAHGRDRTGIVYRDLREAILRGDLAPESVLSQARIARDFGFSRGPVREALRLLQRDGLIHARINQRPRVSGFSPEDLDQLYALRVVIEGLAIAVSVPRFVQADFDDLARALEEMEELAGKDVERWDEPHRRFHVGLIQHAGSRTVRLFEQLFDHAERYRRFSLAQAPRGWSSGAAEHRLIVDACIARDAGAAGEALARHLSRTALEVLMAIAPDYEPAGLRVAVRQVIAAAGPRGEPARGLRGEPVRGIQGVVG